MKSLKLCLFLGLFFVAGYTSSQVVNDNNLLRDSLSRFSSVIWKQKSDSSRLAASEVFFVKFREVLDRPGSGLIPFDSVSGITRAASEDSKFRIFTWNVPLDDGTNRYFGFIQVINDSSIVMPLRSSGKDQPDLAGRQFTILNWYGAIYYRVIQQQVNGRPTYTLLGWDGYTSISNRKLIDIISFDSNGNLLFGLPVFKTAEGIRPRVVFEYAEKAGLLLRYDYQSIRVEKRKKIRKEATWLIVMDRLIPADPSLKGIFKYYVPAGDVYDGFVFRNGYWVLVEDVEVANN